jgi:hypothetical protein
MHEILRATKLIADLEGELEKVPEHREGKNLRYEMVNAGMVAFAMFFVQNPSFLTAHREMKGRKGRSNAEKLFGLSSYYRNDCRRIGLQGSRREYNIKGYLLV